MPGHVDRIRRPIMMVGQADTLLNPMLTLAGELARRGVDDLLFATDEPLRADVEALTAASEVTFISLGDVVPELSPWRWDDQTYREVTQHSKVKAFRAMLRKMAEPTRIMDKYRRLESAVNKHQPALMVIDMMAMFATDLAITKRIPYVLSVPLLPSNVMTIGLPGVTSLTPRDFPTPFSGLPYPVTLAQHMVNRLFRLRMGLLFISPTMVARLVRYRKVHAELGVSPRTREPLARVHYAERVLCYSVAELDYPFPMPPHVRLVGTMVPPLPQAENGEIIAWLDAQSSVIYQAFGTIARLTRTEIAALVDVARRLEGRHQVLWKLSAEQQRMLPSRALPANLRIESWLPSQLDVLAHPNVTLFFNHSGTGAYHEGLYFGKPQVMRPLWMDCHDIAARSRDLGIGLILDHPDTIDPDDVTDKLLRVLNDPSYRERAEHFATLLRAAGGRKAAADILLELPALTGIDRHKQQ